MAEGVEDAIVAVPAPLPAVPTAVATEALEAAKAYARQALAPGNPARLRHRLGRLHRLVPRCWLRSPAR